MADEKKPSSDKPTSPAPLDPFVEIATLVLVLLVVMYAFNGVVSYFTGNKLFSSGWSGLSPRGLLLSATKPISSLLNPIGSKFVVTSNNADLFDSPGEKKIASKKLGDKGTIVGGPVTEGGVKYWKVRFDDGSRGWISEKDIANLPQKITPMSDMSTLLGTSVETTRETAVFSEPGVNQIAVVPAGQKATIIEGPIIKDGIKYWHVRLEDGTEGWVSEDSLDSTEYERKPLSEMPTLIGGTVSTNKDDVALYDSPGGNRIAKVKKGVSGKIIEGPLIVNGIKYWHVRFEDGTEGWVSENDIDYIEESDQGFIFKMITSFWSAVSVLKYIFLLFIVLSIPSIVYLYKEIVKLRKSERLLLYPNGVKEQINEVGLINPDWERILILLESKNENDWRQAVMEADIMLSQLLRNMYLPGDTIGEKLKAVETADFTTIDKAWEAHKFRNNIAHDGVAFVINEHQVKRILDLYKSVFEEFGIIEKLP